VTVTATAAAVTFAPHSFTDPNCSNRPQDSKHTDNTRAGCLTKHRLAEPATRARRAVINRQQVLKHIVQLLQSILSPPPPPALLCLGLCFLLLARHVFLHLAFIQRPLRLQGERYTAEADWLCQLPLSVAPFSQ